MVMATYTAEQRDEALALYVAYGTSEASRRTSIPKSTIDSWLAAPDFGRSETKKRQRLQRLPRLMPEPSARSCQRRPGDRLVETVGERASPAQESSITGARPWWCGPGFSSSGRESNGDALHGHKGPRRRPWSGLAPWTPTRRRREGVQVAAPRCRSSR